MGIVRSSKRIIAFALSAAICGCLICEKNHDYKDDLSAYAENNASDYSDKLDELSKEQQKLDKQIQAAEDNIQDESEKQNLIKAKITSVNKKIALINSYMTKLEIEMGQNQRNIDKKQKEIDEGVDKFKKRLRAMYVAGDSSYTSMLLESGDFYDVLMRVELIKRVAKHDNEAIDTLVSAKKEFEKLKTKLETKKKDYDKQNTELEKQKKELDKLYNSSEKLKAEYEQQKAKLRQQHEQNEKERAAVESQLQSLLAAAAAAQAAASVPANDASREAAEAAATESIRQGVSNSSFAWPAPGNYVVTSGVGPRWGTQHNGMDISGSRGAAVCATASGQVIVASATCPHNYGKNASCGCGGGYGNYVLIDHGNGFASLYGHLTSLNVSVGQTVSQGQTIGAMGSTGYSTGDHLHFEIRYQGVYVDPALYVNM